MNQSLTKRKVKSIINYLSTIFSWALFCILIFFAVALLWYYLDVKINTSKDSSYNPKVSIYTIISPSMVPTINVYDVIFNKKIKSPTEIQIGDIITFKSTSPISVGKTVTHRVIDIEYIDGEYRYVTKGDNNLVKDEAPALYENVIGIAMFKIPQLGRVQFFVASKTGWITVVVIPALFVIIKDILKLIKVSKRNKEANKENTLLVENSNSYDKINAGDINNES